jgi:hypothetical protein
MTHYVREKLESGVGKKRLYLKCTVLIRQQSTSIRVLWFDYCNFDHCVSQGGLNEQRNI